MRVRRDCALGDHLPLEFIGYVHSGTVAMVLASNIVCLNRRQLLLLFPSGLVGWVFEMYADPVKGSK
jgi:hypothetical protein